ncbi:DNA primase family protein [Nocardioides pinisoli]|uniref:SF3 helicase domain-containing protein n=1 Tax=Nocardioides pinisoli TaxID=2950279 RepID=A0ABT1KRN3_9ACTN|nr:DNA primase family protein [Nocardioides pinisoli]MCP3420327.1 hypothetical protein [Nocardioides pinisoli]
MTNMTIDPSDYLPRKGENTEQAAARIASLLGATPTDAPTATEPCPAARPELHVVPDLGDDTESDLVDFDFDEVDTDSFAAPAAPGVEADSEFDTLAAALSIVPDATPAVADENPPRDRSLSGKDRVRARKAAKVLSPVQALRSVQQTIPDCTRDDYVAAYEAANQPLPADWAIDYLAARKVDPKVAAARGYRSGTGALPTPPDGCGTWTNDQQTWAVGGNGREWLIIPWVGVHGKVVGWQVRWAEDQERVSQKKNKSGELVLDKDKKPIEEKHKFDFPGGRSKATMDRLVDARHVNDQAKVLAIIESPVRADALASITPAGVLSIVAVGGISMAYEGKSNPNNENDHKPRLSPDVLKSIGYIEGEHILWIPDSDHALNPQCNDATIMTVESLLEAGATWVGVVDVPDQVVHPLSGRVQYLGKGAGLDDIAAAMHEMRPGHQWLGDLLADALDGRKYTTRYVHLPDNDVQGLAEAVARELVRKDRFRYIHTSQERGIYHHYAGGHWGIDIAESAATIEATCVANNVMGMGDSDDTDKARYTARKNIEPAVKRAVKTTEGKSLIVAEAAWEPREWAEYLPTPSGLLHLETKAIAPHTPAAMNLGVTNVDYVPGAQDDDWDAFREAFFVSEKTVELFDDRGESLGFEPVRDANGQIIWVHDAEKERMVQEVAGAGLMGRCFDTMLFMLGGGGAGISTFTGAISGVMPAVWLGALSSNDLTGEDSRFTLSGIYLSRLTEVNEFNPGDRLNGKLAKQVWQDASAMKVEPKFGDPFLSPVRSTCICTTNHLPAVGPKDGQDNSMRRRVCIARFPRIVANPDSTLPQRLATREARETILAWMVEGAHRFLNRPDRKPFRSPESVRLVEAWLSDHDRLGSFIKEKLKKDPKGYVERHDLWEEYRTWCIEDKHIIPMGDSKFYAALGERPEFGDSNGGGNRRQNPDTKVHERGWKGWSVVS